MESTHNMRYYEQGRSVPQDAQKTFSNGRFSGTDINPMWRIKKLTEMFGPAGLGWYTEVTRQEVVHADDDNMMVFVDVNLYIKEGDAWSKPIFGTGGNTLKAKGRGDDEGYKKAYTDALSIACKALGIGADIWYANDTTSKYSDKYVDAPRGSTEAAQDAGQKKLEALNAKQAKMKGATKNVAPVTCTRCGEPITGWARKDRTFTASEVVDNAMQLFGAAYCYPCCQALSKSREAQEAVNVRCN